MLTVAKIEESNAAFHLLSSMAKGPFIACSMAASENAGIANVRPYILDWSTASYRIDRTAECKGIATLHRALVKRESNKYQSISWQMPDAEGSERQCGHALAKV